MHPGCTDPGAGSDGAGQFEAPRSEDELSQVTARFAARLPLLANMVEGGATPMKNADDLGALGFKIVIFPGGIVRAVAKKGAAALTAPISDIMTSKVTTCGQSHSVNQVMELMTNGRFRHLPVEEGGKLIGIISIGDVVRMRIEQVEREAEEIKAYIAS